MIYQLAKACFNLHTGRGLALWKHPRWNRWKITPAFRDKAAGIPPIAVDFDKCPLVDGSKEMMLEVFDQAELAFRQMDASAPTDDKRNADEPWRSDPWRPDTDNGLGGLL